MASAAALFASTEMLEALLGACDTCYTWRLSCRLSTVSRTLNAAVKQLRSQMHTAVVDDAGVCEMDDITLRVLVWTGSCTSVAR